jgi:Nuclease A inhibitor-like protein
MNKVALCLVLALASSLPACASDFDTTNQDEATSGEDPVVLATDTKIKNQIVKAATGVSFLSESDHPLVWIRSTSVANAPANAWFIHHAFSKVTDGDSMADKPLSQMKSETVPFETFASTLKPVNGEDADNYAYHVQMTNVLDAIRKDLKNPVVIRLGRQSGNGNYLVGAISVYIVGTLPSGKIGGLFTVSVET